MNPFAISLFSFNSLLILVLHFGIEYFMINIRIINNDNLGKKYSIKNAFSKVLIYIIIIIHDKSGLYETIFMISVFINLVILWTESHFSNFYSK